MKQKGLLLFSISLITVCALLTSCQSNVSSSKTENELINEILAIFENEGLSLKEVNQTWRTFDFKESKEKRYKFFGKKGDVFIFYDITNMEEIKTEIRRVMAETEFVNVPYSDVYQDFGIVVLLKENNDEEKLGLVLKKLSEIN